MVVFSGIQPTGKLHIGNYLGAIKNWVKLQETSECFFCVVDLHAITVQQDPQKLNKACIATTASYIACGIKKENIFLQNLVSEHSELAWILSCFTPLGWLNRMTQFKDKTKNVPEKSKLGLYAYPTLQAADILLYETTHVPVGEDQTQHVEFTRDLANSFNKYINSQVFTLPELITPKNVDRVMSLRDGNMKMSKSDVSDYSRIHLTDSSNEIADKIKKAKTDSMPIPSEEKELINRPEAKNLLNIFSAISNQSMQETLNTYSGKTFSSFKIDLAELIISELTPIGKEISKLEKDETHIKSIIKNGTARAKKKASQTLLKVHNSLGMLRF